MKIEPQSVASVASSQNGPKIKEVSQQFEAIFLQFMLRSMRQSVQKSGLLDGGNAEKIYREMLDAQYATKMSQTDELGISKMLEKQLYKTMAGKKTMDLVQKQGADLYKRQALELQSKL